MEINPPLEGSNELENPDMFMQRLNYKRLPYIYQIDPIPLDMIYEKPFYGKVDVYGNTVYPSEIDMVQIPGDGLVMVHDFVAAAFRDLKRFIDQERYFTDLFSSYIPKAATRNFHKLYQDHFVDNVYDVFINDYVLDSPDVNRKIKSFDDFVKEFVSFSKLMLDQFPITKTAFIMSTQCPHSISGLIIDLENGPMDDDANKYENFISKNSFDQYIKVVTTFGFFIDKNVPWRIAVNFGHPKTKNYMQSFGTSIKNNAVFDDYFYRAEYYSYEDFKSRMWNGYQMLILDSDTSSWGIQYEVRNCIKTTWNDMANNVFKTVGTKKDRKGISAEYDGQFQVDYPDSFFLPHYFKIRAAESNLNYHNRKMKSNIKKILDIYKTFGIDRAIENIEKITQQSRIYVYNDKDKAVPHKIKYFGNSTSSGLYSYLEPDKINLETEAKEIKPVSGLNTIY